MIPVRITIHATTTFPPDGNLATPMAALDASLNALRGVFTQWGETRLDGPMVSLTLQACASINDARGLPALQADVRDVALRHEMRHIATSAEAMDLADVVVGSPLALYLAITRAEQREPATVD
jgi:hypothetical protein